MRRIAIYGKGGIGKSTVSANISDALAARGLKVMQIGCDPKADSTALLTGTPRVRPVLDLMRAGEEITLEAIIGRGRSGCLCAECGGPKPGTGCAGRGIIAAFEQLERLGAIETYRPDVLIYDVLGDVVCGGFAMPIRNGYARDVYIVTSGEMMALYAANNIAEAVNGFRQDGYARLGGLIQNSRGVADEDGLIDRAAAEMGTEVVFRVPRDPEVQRCEAAGPTVVRGAPGSAQAEVYRRLAETIYARSEDVGGGMRVGAGKDRGGCRDE